VRQGLGAGDPGQEVWLAWNAKEVVHQIYDHTDPELATEWVTEIRREFTDQEMPTEPKKRWRLGWPTWHGGTAM
jgi:hypothetical protein